jgi:hypothetical protein
MQERIEAEADRAHRNEGEAVERNARIRQLREQLDDAEQRLTELRRHAGTDRVRARIEALEAALKDESQRVGAIEDNLRAAASSLQKEHGT